LKVGVDDGQTVPTCKEVFLGAEYPEKEIGDLFGIVFAGNQLEPGERFMMPDDWVGFPLRKEYPLGGEDVLFDRGDYGPAVEDVSMPHAGESFEGKTGSEDVSGR
jgi:NADH-quinone oxidoreductase subunit C